jgi:hypothetical protein
LFVAPKASLSYTNEILPGLNLIANQLDHGANTLNEVLPNVPSGVTIEKWNEAAHGFEVYSFDDADGTWGPGNPTLGAGEAAFLSSPAAFELIFTGQTRSETQPLALTRNQVHYLSSTTARRASFTDITGLFPREGDVLFRYNAATQKYQTNRFTGGAWDLGEPISEVGEAVAMILASPLVDCSCVAKLHELVDTGCQAPIPDVCAVAFPCWYSTQLICSQTPPAGTLVGPGATPIR